jgi:hypothetical protein
MILKIFKADICSLNEIKKHTSYDKVKIKQS